MTRYRKQRIVLFWVATLFTYVSAILPQEEAPSLVPSDKLNHMIAFFTLSVLARAAYPRVAAWKSGIALSAFGAFIEVSQMVPFIHRDAELMDWVADSAAILIGLAVACLVKMAAPKIFAD